MGSSPTYTLLPHGLDQKDIVFEAKVRNRFYTAGAISLVAISLFIFGFGCFALGQQSVTLDQCGRKLSTWSPALEAVEYRQVTFDGDFLAPSIWRGSPSEELDEAWDRISVGGAGSLRIQKSDLDRLNKTQTANATIGFSDGTDDLQVMLEVFHQLHCLNELRKKTWPDHYPKPAKEYERVDRAHTDHCIEMLRINLMCTADVTPITAVIPGGKGSPTPDFNTLHTCRNFDKILQYVRDNAQNWGLWA